MKRFRFAIIGVIIALAAVAFQFRGQISGIVRNPFKGMFAARETTVQDIASTYVPSQPGNAVPDPQMTPFEEPDYQKLLFEVKSLNVDNFTKIRKISDYGFRAINVFVPRITSSEELGFVSAEDQKRFSVVLAPDDMLFMGFYNSPSGMAAVLKTRASQSGINVVKTGEMVPGSNLRLKAATERYVILENVINQTDGRVYLSERGADQEKKKKSEQEAKGERLH